MTNVSYEADFVGKTADEAYQAANDAVPDIPFEPEWYHIGVKNYFRPKNVDSEDDDGEERWSWVATLKATG